MKKLGIFIAASALTLSLAACGSGASSTNNYRSGCRNHSSSFRNSQRQQVLQLN